MMLSNVNLHTVSQIIKINMHPITKNNSYLLTDEFIDKLAPLVGSQSLPFLLELDMTFQDWEQIKYKQSERRHM
jgi:hypothetical protein